MVYIMVYMLGLSKILAHRYQVSTVILTIAARFTYNCIMLSSAY
jgi:hypothetical protein